QIMWVFGSGFPKSHNLKGDRAGWGTALKPAHEPICVARKPFSGTVATNMARWGTGGLNIDGCRVPAVDAEALAKNWDRDTTVDMRGGKFIGGKSGSIAMTAGASALGRWPANLIHDGSDEVVALFPAQAGASAPVMGTEPTA
ncbi:site-specific DNA-methyltransferase, partial [Pseudomonas gingeri]|nr:site-specific DNA-methyltransferase [Pseudomonas gingeri]